MRMLKGTTLALAAALLCPALAMADPGDEITVANDSYSGDTFNGYGDSGQALDPDPSWPFQVGDMYYMVYTYASEETTYDGSSYINDTYATAVHFAYSADGGESWTKPPTLPALWPWSNIADPKSGSNDIGLLNHETPTIAVDGDGPNGGKRWFGSRLTYYQNADHYYNPDYAEHWVIEISSASGTTPAVLNAASLGADDTTRIGLYWTDPNWLGEGDTNLYDVDEALGYYCGILNNPSIYYSESAEKLYLATECVAFDGEERDWDTSGIFILSTTASGDPVDWEWSYEGVIANDDIADELVAGTQIQALGVMQPFITKGAQGEEVLLVSIAVEDQQATEGFSSLGCSAIEIDSLEPGLPQNPYELADMLARDGSGDLVLKQWVAGAGACTYAPGSDTGIAYNEVTNNVEFRLHRSEASIP